MSELVWELRFFLGIHILRVLTWVIPSKFNGSEKFWQGIIDISDAMMRADYPPPPKS